MPDFFSRLSASNPWLDGAADALATLFKPIVGHDAPYGMRDLLYGTWLRHPLHPPMTDISIGAWTTSMALDIFGEEDAADLALTLGTLSSLGTAITGAAQWYDMQNDEEPRRLGALHALLNTTALGFYLTSIAFRGKDRRGAGILTAWTGHALLTASGYIGGHLSFGLGVGVNHEAFAYPPTDWTDAIADADLPEGKLRRVELDDASIMLLKQDGQVLATSAVCTHVGGPLDEGEHEGTRVTCPWHYSVFDIRDGRVIHGPATASLVAYDTRIQNGTVQIRVRKS